MANQSAAVSAKCIRNNYMHTMQRSATVHERDQITTSRTALRYIKITAGLL